MVTKIKRALSGALLAAFFGLSPCVDIAGQDELTRKLIAAAEEFKQKNGLSDEQFKGLVGELVLNPLCFRKGGVGIIDGKDGFILLDDEGNTLLLEGRKKWQGEKSSHFEVVVMDGRHVIRSVPVSEEEASRLTIVLFSPTSARYIDFPTNSACRYERFRPTNGSGTNQQP